MSIQAILSSKAERAGTIMGVLRTPDAAEKYFTMIKILDDSKGFAVGSDTGQFLMSSASSILQELEDALDALA